MRCRPVGPALFALLLLAFAPSASAAGSLTGTATTLTTAQTFNLTTQGTGDWAHWGTTTTASFDHRATVTGGLSNYTLVGTGTVARYATQTGGGGGGGIFNLNANGNMSLITVANTILYGNAGGDYGYSGSNILVNYCDILGGYPGISNIDADPLFVNSPTDLHLQLGSPCIGAGTASGAPSMDITGLTRPNPPSIGAYEIAPIVPPTNLTATAGVGKVTLHWTAPEGVSGATYSLYRGTAPGGETFYKAVGTATTFTNGLVTAGTTYYYTVKTVVGSQTSAASNEASAMPTGTTGAPMAPTAVKTVPGDTKVVLTWTAPMGSVTSYTLYRGTSASALSVYRAGITVTTFTNTLVTNGTPYYYAVVAVNSSGSSPQSAVVSATPLALPGAPTALTAVASGGRVTLHWTAATGTVASYSVYRGTAAGGEVFYKTAGTATTFVNAVVTPGTRYYYLVRAVNSTGAGAASNEASATP